MAKPAFGQVGQKEAWPVENVPNVYEGNKPGAKRPWEEDDEPAPPEPHPELQS